MSTLGEKVAAAWKDEIQAKDKEIERLQKQVAELEVYKAAIEDIVSDPITCEALGMKRGVAQILAIARGAMQKTGEPL